MKVSSLINVTREVCARVPTEFGEFQLCLYTNDQDEKEHLALVMGEVGKQENVLVRVHSECFTGDVIGSQRCDCGEQFQFALEQIAEAGLGILVYLRQEGRGIGLRDKLRAYNLQDEGYDTVEANLLLGHQADERDYSVAAKILRDLDVRSIRLLTNNPEKIEALKAMGLDLTGRVSLVSDVNPENARYLATKATRMRHLINVSGIEQEVAEKNGRSS